MKFAAFTAALLSSVAVAQNATAGAAYLQAVLGALTSANLTGLVGVASAIANTTEGMALLGQLATGNKTVFAPNNAAFAAVPASISSNTTLLTQILSYHILNNTYSASGVRASPAHTIARTLLKGGGYSLPGNFSAPLVLTKMSANATSFSIVQASDNATAMGPAKAANLNVYIIPEVLSLPPNISAAVNQLAPSLAGVVQQAGLLGPLAAAKGITIFAPNDGAISGAAATLGMLNATVIQTVLANHVINGTVVYSTGLATGNYTSAAGQPFKFVTNANGTYVMSGTSMARIVKSDIILSNGVVHLIDGVLADTMSNTTAAAAAYSSAVAAAATMTEANVAVTATSAAATGGASSTGGAATSSKAAAGMLTPLGFSATSMLGGVVAVAGAFIGGGMVLM